MTPPPTSSATAAAPTETPPPSSTEDQHDSKRKNNQNTKENASVSKTGRNGKRQCTRSATSTTTVSVKQEPNEEERKEHGKKKNDDEKEEEDANQLPTTVKLSEELCRIIDMDTYSRKDGTVTFKKVSKWLRTGDTNFLKSFHVLGAGVIVLNFLTATMNDINCEGNDRSECIQAAAMVILHAAYGGDNDVTNRDIVKKIVASIVDYDGVNILIDASEEYTGGEDESQLGALDSIWTALWNIVSVQDLEFQKEHAMVVFETGIDVISLLKSVDTTQSNHVLEDIFLTLRSLVRHNFMTTEYFFQNNTIISKCLDVFKKNGGAWIDRGEAITHRAALLFYRFGTRGLLVNGDSDYEMLLPFFAFALKQYATNQNVRKSALNMFDVSCTTINDKTILKGSGAMESLFALLQMSNAEIDNDCKTTVGLLVGKIAALE